MDWYIWVLISTIINTLIITTIVDIILMGGFSLKLSGKSYPSEFLVTQDNRIDIQSRYECAGYSSAYLLRHYGIEATGEEIYAQMPHRMASGYVYPKGICRMLEFYGFAVKYCAGNLNALKKEVSKGVPVIAMIRVRTDKSWLHFVPIVGYDEENIFIAESLAEYVNCEEEKYNRRISNKEFKRLWNTSMLKMPLYRNTFYVLEKDK